MHVDVRRKLGREPLELVCRRLRGGRARPPLRDQRIGSPVDRHRCPWLEQAQCLGGPVWVEMTRRQSWPPACDGKQREVERCELRHGREQIGVPGEVDALRPRDQVTDARARGRRAVLGRRRALPRWPSPSPRRSRLPLRRRPRRRPQTGGVARSVPRRAAVRPARLVPPARGKERRDDPSARAIRALRPPPRAPRRRPQRRGAGAARAGATRGRSAVGRRQAPAGLLRDRCR